MNSTIYLILFLFALKAKGFYVDPFAKLGVWNGWGTTLSWFGKALGGLPEDVQEKITHELFSQSRLGLNIVRYPIGATTPGDRSCGNFYPGGDHESFRDGPDKPYIWTRDLPARKVLLAAKALGVDTFEAVSHSPPSWLTRSNCSKGNPDGAPLHDNFDPVNADTFADYLTEVISYYKTNVSVSFNSIAPFVWPSSGDFVGSAYNREGCNMERSTMAQVIRSLDVSLKAKGLKCNISVADEISIVEEIKTQNYFEESGVNSHYSKIGARHASSTGRQAELYKLAQQNKKDLSANDFGFTKSEWPDMKQALELANNVIYVLKNLMPTAWMYWQSLDDSNTPHWQLLQVPYDNATVENIQLNSGFYALMHFSKYIRKGYTMVHITDPNSVAAIGNENTVVVTVNSEKHSVEKSFDLGLFYDGRYSITAFQTTSTKPHIAIDPPVMDWKQFDISLPPESITTLILSSTLRVPYTGTIITNGDFETVDSNVWILQHGSREDNGVNGQYTFEGLRSGYLDLNESKLTLMQNMNMTSLSENLYVSAYCATTDQSNTTFFGMIVNGIQGPEIAILPDRGYQLYGFKLRVPKQTECVVYLRSDQGNHTAQIDNVRTAYCYNNCNANPPTTTSATTHF